MNMYDDSGTNEYRGAQRKSWS